MKWKIKKFIYFIFLIIIFYMLISFISIFKKSERDSDNFQQNESKKYDNNELLSISYQINEVAASVKKKLGIHNGIIIEAERNPMKIDKFKSLTICVVCCGTERLAETVTALQSAVIFSHSPLTLLVYTDPENFIVFRKMREDWPASSRSRVSLSLQVARYPDTVQQDTWKSLFKQCASLRLFLSNLLPSTDALLYMDTDVMFLSPPEELWHHFRLMNSSQLAALAPEHQDSSVGWYNRFAKHPFYGKLGLNSGVVLMNLTRMRSFGWDEYIVPLYEQYESHIRWGDQDLLNILFHFHSELVYEIDCSYNYRPDHCMYGSGCPAAEEQGVRILHANRRAAVTDKFPPFRLIYQAIQQLGAGSTVAALHTRLLTDLHRDTSTKCSSKPHIFLIHIGRNSLQHARVPSHT